MGAARRFVQNPGKNAICYYRYSSDAQREASIDQQKQAAHDYADAHGYHIIGEYEDKAIQMAAFSGQQGRNSRPVKAIIGGQQAA